MLNHRERHRDGNGGLALDFLLDRNAEDVDRDLITRLFIGEGKSAACLPWPVGVVKNFKFNDLSHARSNLEDLLRLALADGASLFPALLAVKVLPIVLAPLHFLLHLLRVLLRPFAPFAHLALELLHHFMERRTTIAAKTTRASASAPAATTASSATSSTLKASHHLVDELHWIIRWLIRCFLALLLCSRGILIKHGNHDIGSTTVCSNLKERMLAWETLFAACAVVKVLANGAFVADTFDWSHSATVTGDIGVSHLSFLGGHLNWW